ncbi:heme ABC transporter ATP-binding protein [Algoriphagus sp. H41]|uniref:Heme ABC transporter ATP-binding protein n=1 Tax=Algoriphagus oliviformis TaxID=2811231 RepID=A0ABS3C0C2_9BACT|nr:heme ABC transporter ATP-binding protein [Algoriphagus oliviformis]MBN7810089.1 heme ABC transporter ATP-binding protein [Algoriphagus oliviformis]
MLKATNVHFCIRQRPIVDEVSLELNPGEILAILGPNGAGKSTFFKILSGEVRCKHGAIGYNGHDIHKLKSRELAEVRAVMPQHTQVNFPFTVQEVVELGLISTRAKDPAKLIREVLEATHTLHLSGQVFNTLSGGEKQRVQLARVLVQIWEAKPFPRYLLLDEPTSSLDIAQQHAVLKILKTLKSRNIGILVILHELNLAAQYADKIALLKNGMVAKAGTVEEVLDEGILAQVFDHPIQLISNPATGGVFISSLASQPIPTHTFKQA